MSVLPDLKTYLSTQPKAKLVLWIGLTILTPIFTIGIILYAFTFHGMEAFITWVDFLIPSLVILIIFGVAIPFLVILDIKIAKNPKRLQKIKAQSSTLRLPSRAMWAILLIATITPVSLFIWVKSSHLIRTGNTPPQLIIADGSGTNGIPDLGVIFWTEEPSRNYIEWGYETITNPKIEETKASQSHAFMLTSLLPAKTYWYTINGDSKKYEFRTPASTSNKIKFCISSDSHIGAATASKSATENILGHMTDPTRANDYFFFLGDFIANGFEDVAWNN